MLSQQDNEMLTHVGPGTPMGNLLRQYWAPALLSEELPSPDCPPIRVKLMCEELIAFRNTSGEVGLVANACPHRARASCIAAPCLTKTQSTRSGRRRRTRARSRT